jgi:hypothetical protein
MMALRLQGASMSRVQKIVVHVVLIAGFTAITYHYGHMVEHPHAQASD